MTKQIKSFPASVDSNNCTECAKTARRTWWLFGIYLPQWQAYAALEHPGKGCIWTIPEWKEHLLPDHTWWWIQACDIIEKWKELSADVADMAVSSDYPTSKEQVDLKIQVDLVADLAVDSDTPNWLIYWHRAIAFQKGWKWYILDPYIKDKNGKSIELPIDLDVYVWSHWFGKKILKCNFYKAEWYNAELYEEYKSHIFDTAYWRTEVDGWKWQKEVNAFIKGQDDMKTLSVNDKLLSHIEPNADDLIQLIDDNEWEKLYDAYKLKKEYEEKRGKQYTLDDILILFKKPRESKIAVFINMCRNYNWEIDWNIQNKIMEVIIDKKNIREFVDAASYLWILSKFNLSKEQKVMVQSLAYNKLAVWFNEEKWPRQFHYDSKYNTFNNIDREKKKEEILNSLVWMIFTDKSLMNNILGFKRKVKKNWILKEIPEEEMVNDLRTKIEWKIKELMYKDRIGNKVDLA